MTGFDNYFQALNLVFTKAYHTGTLLVEENQIYRSRDQIIQNNNYINSSNICSLICHSFHFLHVPTPYLHEQGLVEVQ